jgi:hypothetical protein
MRYLRLIHAAVVMWPTYGWQDWRCPIDRAAMMRDYELGKGSR